MNTDELRAADIEAAVRIARDNLEMRCPHSSPAICRALMHLADELAASQRREKRLKRQVELMGWLIGSHESDGYEMFKLLDEISYYEITCGEPENPNREAALKRAKEKIIDGKGFPSFDQMGDPSDEGEYTDDDLDMLKDHWPAAADELLRRQMAADWPTGETMQEIDARENPR